MAIDSDIGRAFAEHAALAAAAAAAAASSSSSIWPGSATVTDTTISDDVAYTDEARWTRSRN